MSGTEPQSYHALTRGQRDHLLATSQHDDQLPHGQAIQARVEQLRGGECPSNTTTYTVLTDLTDWGLLERKQVNGKTVSYRLTDAGMAMLADAAAQFPD